MAEIRRVGVVGAGLMGHGISQVAAEAGYDVVLRDAAFARITPTTVSNPGGGR